MAAASTDWFTKTTWTEADQADFFARLKKSRGAGHKAQYLVVQARRLEETGSPELLPAALSLLDKMLTEFPEDFFLSQAHGQKANCLWKIGKADEALVHYRLALDAERKFPNLRTAVLHDFGVFVVQNKLSHLYDEALNVLDTMKIPGTPFPYNVFRDCGIRALVAEERGEIENARKWAQAALDAAAKNASGFRNHPNFGLVKDRETEFYKAVEAVATKHIQSFSN